LVVVHLGGGRLVESDRIDPRVGLTGVLPLGTKGCAVTRSRPFTPPMKTAWLQLTRSYARNGWTVEIPDLIERIDP
jgi:thymidine phosphorylase